MRTLGATDLDVLEALFEQLPGAPFFVKDAELRYVAANSAMAQLCGFERASELVGRRATDIFSAPLAAHYEDLDRQVLATGQPVRDILDRSVDRAGRAAWLLFARIPVVAADGAVVGIAATSRRLPQGALSEQSYRRVQAATDRLRQDFNLPHGLGKLAADLRSSPAQLERDFRRLFDATPQQMRHRLRLQHACRLLQDTSASIASIAQECGYSDHSAFTRRFVAHMRMTPRAWRGAFQPGKSGSEGGDARFRQSKRRRA